MTEPVHEHDCRMCTYVGGDSPQPGERRVNQVDMYICGNELIRRYSSDPPDYGASLVHGLVGGPGARYQRVLEAARQLGVAVVRSSNDWPTYRDWKLSQ